jgi:hypothetical protein
MRIFLSNPKIAPKAHTVDHANESRFGRLLRAAFAVSVLATVAPAFVPASSTAAFSASSRVARCAALATRAPTRLSAAYSGRLLDPNKVQTLATLPDISLLCGSVGQRVFVLQDIQLQQEHKQSLGFGTGTRVWKPGLKHRVTLASGDAASMINERATTTLRLYCYKTASAADGVNKARAVYLLEFKPRNHAEKTATRVVRATVRYPIGYC